MTTILRSVASGATATFPISYEYLDKSFTQVRLDGVLLTSDDFTWPDNGNITLTGGAPNAGALVERRRVTPAGALTSFSPGNLDSADLNVATTQARHIAEEGRDTAGDVAARAIIAVPPGTGYDLPGASAGKLLGWNADGTGLENKTAAAFGAVEIITDLAGATDENVPSALTAKAYADTKAPLKTSLTGQLPADSNPGGFAGYALNLWNITDDATVGDAADPANQVYGILIKHTYGGDNLRGTRNSVSIQSTLTAASKDESGGAQNYAALQVIGTAGSGDNGTDTGSGAKGAMFAFNPVMQVGAEAKNLLHTSIAEWNMGAVEGSSMRYKCFTNFANYPNDAVKGADVDTVLWFYKQGASAVGYDYGLLFSNEVLGSTGVQLIDPAGTVLAAKDDGTSAYGIDFSDWNFTGAAFRSKSFQVDAHGEVAATSLHLLGLNGSTSILATATVPTAAGDSLGKTAFGYQNPTSFVDYLSAYVEGAAYGAWTVGSSHPSILRFWATLGGNTAPSEQMRLAPNEATPGKTAMFVNVEGTLRQIEVGANDSAGAGFRQLRIANPS
jgi:hypothetical protein